MMKKTGFTLVETLVGVGILVLATTAAFAAAQNSISTSSYAKDQIIAFYLAQEAVEHIRNMRDENGVAGRFWLTSISAGGGDPCYVGTTCIIDAVANTTSRCSSGPDSCPVLRQNTTTGFYGYDSSWTPTRFKRSVTLEQIATDGTGNVSEVSMTVSVKWSKGILNREFKVRENILNWQ